MLLQNPNLKPVDQDSLKSSSLVSLNRERNKTSAVSCLPRYQYKMIRSKAMDHKRPHSFCSHGAGHGPEETRPRCVERKKRTGKTKHVNNKYYENTLVLCPFERTENKISANFN